LLFSGLQIHHTSPFPLKPIGVESLAMKTASCLIVISAILHPASFAQTHPNHDTQQPYEIQISAGVAQKLLIHKVEPDACPHIPMAARFTATIVVAIEIDKNGNVLYPKVISGPAMLRKPVLDAIRKYKYKPYLLNGKAVDVETTVSVPIDTLHGCPDS
jgi:outer membrane biosynthesis protein TonB